MILILYFCFLIDGLCHFHICPGIILSAKAAVYAISSLEWFWDWTLHTLSQWSVSASQFSFRSKTICFVKLLMQYGSWRLNARTSTDIYNVIWTEFCSVEDIVDLSKCDSVLHSVAVVVVRSALGVGLPCRPCKPSLTSLFFFDHALLVWLVPSLPPSLH
jgi:hypothetical protein